MMMSQQGPGGSGGVQKERIKRLNKKPLRKGKYVLLWVQQDVRAEYNHALEHAIELANRIRIPVLAIYGLYEKFPGANERSFSFLLGGLHDLQASLARRGVHLAVVRKPPPEAVALAAVDAAGIVCDCGYARICRAWRHQVAEQSSCVVFQVETSVVVPVETASSQLEPSAATLRPKIQRHLPRFLVPLPEIPLTHPSATISGSLPLLREALRDADVSTQLSSQGALLASLDIDRSVPAVSGQKGGAEAAARVLQVFVAERLTSYGNGKTNDPGAQCNSFLSPYLHFGHISALQVALVVRGAAQPDMTQTEGSHRTLKGATAGEAFLEELIIRRELARNLAWFAPEAYDSWEVLPGWAKDSLTEHRGDPRGRLYTLAELERGETDDKFWNSAQWQMLATGHMHNYMRMYWCKRLLEWSPDPRTAFKWAVHMNDKYQLDGRDENGYMGIAWCFGQHDKPFPERPVFGTVRSMTPGGLASKFDMERYCRMVKKVCQDQRGSAVRALLPKAAVAGESSILSFFGKRSAGPAAAAMGGPTGPPKKKR